jgi:diguanylate cyclase (GGDEF)-like protein
VPQPDVAQVRTAYALAPAEPDATSASEEPATDAEAQGVDARNPEPVAVESVAAGSTGFDEPSPASVPEQSGASTPLQPMPGPATTTQAPVPVGGGSGRGWLVAALAACAGIAFWVWRRSQALAVEARQLLRQQRVLKSANVRLQDESERLRQQATNDPLTGALNRQAFATALRELLDHVAHYNRAVWLVMIDLDHFKAINDRLGHLAGDSALKLVTGIIHEHLVSADLFGRFGGDEFLVGLADHDAASASRLAEALRAAVQAAAANQAPPLPGLSLSIGLACADADIGYSADSLFARADAALYEAKRRGRNRVVVADENVIASADGLSTRHL